MKPGACHRFPELSDCLDRHAVARLFQLPRLEDRCAEFIAKHLEAVLDRPEQCEQFAKMIESDAEQVPSRELTDTIDVIDQVRYHITTTCVNTFSDIQEADAKLALIDSLLEKLGLDA